MIQMRLSPALISLGCLIGLISAQTINFNSLICSKMGISKTSTVAVKNKFKTMILNLAKDTTVTAQKTRAKTWMTNNAKEVGISQDNLPWMITNAQGALEARWRAVAYYKGLLAKIKPKLVEAKFTEVKNLLWKCDVDATNNAMYAYSNWKTQALALLADAKKTEIQKIITDWEAADSKKSPKDFNSDAFDQMQPPGFTGCSIN